MGRRGRLLVGRKSGNWFSGAFIGGQGIRRQWVLGGEAEIS